MPQLQIHSDWKIACAFFITTSMGSGRIGAKEEKTASEAKPGLGQDTGDEPRGQMRGQVINNDNEEGAHSYQEGESVDGKQEQGGNARKDKGGKTDRCDGRRGHSRPV